MSEEKPKKITLRVIGKRVRIHEIKSDETKVHIGFRPSGKDLYRIVEQCPDLTLIHIPKSYSKTIASTSKMFLKMQNIELCEGDIWGHRSDIDEYVNILI